MVIEINLWILFYFAIENIEEKFFELEKYENVIINFEESYSEVFIFKLYK